MIQLVEVEIRQGDRHNPGGRYKGQLAQCCSCEGTTFLVFVLVGHSHPHLQCASCGEVACTNAVECDQIPPHGRID